MFFYVYKITNTETNQFYLGRHVSTSLTDAYMGSGSSPMLKYKRNLVKEILHVYDNAEQMIQKELQLITENFNNPLCENMIIGDPTYGGVIKHSEISKQKISEGLKKFKDKNPDSYSQMRSFAGKCLKGHKQSAEHIQNLSKVRRGKSKSHEQKKKISESMKGNLYRPRETLCKSWQITNVITNEVFFVDDRVKFCEDRNIKYASFNVCTRNGSLYKKTWLCVKVL